MKSLKRQISRLRHLPFPTFLPLLFWPASFAYLYGIPPSGLLSFIVFYLLISGALFFTIRFRFSALYSAILATAILTVLILRQLRLANTANLSLLIGIALLGIYSKRILRMKNPFLSIPKPEKAKEPPPSEHSHGLVRSFPSDMFKDT